MTDPNPIPLTTLEQALSIARSLRAELEGDNKNSRVFKIFAALSANYLEALIAFLIWKSRRNNPSTTGKRLKL